LTRTLLTGFLTSSPLSDACLVFLDCFASSLAVSYCSSSFFAKRDRNALNYSRAYLPNSW